MTIFLDTMPFCGLFFVFRFLILGLRGERLDGIGKGRFWGEDGAVCFLKVGFFAYS